MSIEAMLSTTISASSGMLKHGRALTLVADGDEVAIALEQPQPHQQPDDCALPAAPSVFSFPAALLVTGMKHVFDNITGDFLKRLSFFPRFQEIVDENAQRIKLFSQLCITYAFALLFCAQNDDKWNL